MKVKSIYKKEKDIRKRKKEFNKKTKERTENISLNKEKKLVCLKKHINCNMCVNVDMLSCFA